MRVLAVLATLAPILGAAGYAASQAPARPDAGALPIKAVASCRLDRATAGAVLARLPVTRVETVRDVGTSLTLNPTGLVYDLPIRSLFATGPTLPGPDNGSKSAKVFENLNSVIFLLDGPVTRIPAARSCWQKVQSGQRCAVGGAQGASLTFQPGPSAGTTYMICAYPPIRDLSRPAPAPAPKPRDPPIPAPGLPAAPSNLLTCGMSRSDAARFFLNQSPRVASFAGTMVGGGSTTVTVRLGGFSAFGHAFVGDMTIEAPYIAGPDNAAKTRAALSRMNRYSWRVALGYDQVRAAVTRITGQECRDSGSLPPWCSAWMGERRLKLSGTVDGGARTAMTCLMDGRARE